ncbi:MAG: purine-nucleoside phosphorylase, partial [Oscillochloris sp.]|nr:purine-nucleoside phosphorylase [Oscillochloris sp.]
MYDLIEQARAVITERMQITPKIGIILGSGL